MLRIIAGKYRHLKIESPDTDKTRPTTDRVREALMSALGMKIVDAKCLDLFSGSGALGLESLSRGAKEVVFVDKAPIAIKTIKKNLDNFHIDNAEILNMDYQKVLKHLYDKNIKLDLIFLDPPYNTNYIEKSIELINEYKLLNQDGLLICESDSLDRVAYPENYQIVKDKKYGDKWVVILKQM